MEEEEDEKLSVALGRGEWVKAIYFGLPMEIQEDGEGVTGQGFFSGWLYYLPFFNGKFMLYRGSYLGALWMWLTVDCEDWEE